MYTALMECPIVAEKRIYKPYISSTEPSVKLFCGQCDHTDVQNMPFKNPFKILGIQSLFFQRTNCELPQTVTFSALTVGLQAQQFILSIYVNQCHDMRALGLIC